MKKIAIAVHGGLGKPFPFLKQYTEEYKNGLAEAAQIGHKILKKGGNALDAVEQAVICLEDNPLFNAGRGSALNCVGEVEMDASIMYGKNLSAGAVSMVRNVKNPISLAKIVMKKTKHVFLSGYGALELAKNEKISLEPDAYFITEIQMEEFKKLNKKESLQKIIKKKILGTVGAVALDQKGNLAAGTSTGGTSNCLPGRIGDSCVIGAGCYANNKSCAISGTGEGEYLIRGVIAHSIAMFIELNDMELQAACDHVLHVRNNNIKHDIGVIALNPKGEVAISHNAKNMKRAWIDTDGKLQVLVGK